MNALRRISDPGPNPERKQFSADLQAQRMSELIRVNRDVGISVRASRNLNPSVALRTDGIFIAAHERTRLDQREVALTAGLLPKPIR